MNILQLARLLFRNALLIFGSGLILSVAVFLFLINSPQAYESKTTIYTGIGTSMNLESTGTVDYYATNMAFDNLLNIISSRETLEEVSLRLLAKHLLLDKADPKYISQSNYDEIFSMVPKEVMNLVVKKNKKEVSESENSNNDTITKTEEVDNTKKKIIFHNVLPDETLFSISRRYNIPLITLMRLNNLEDNLIKVGDKLIVNITQHENEAEQVLPTIEFEKDNDNIYYTVDGSVNLTDIASKFNTTVKDLIIWNNLKDRELETGKTLIVGKTNQIDKIPDYSKDVEEVIIGSNDLAGFIDDSENRISIREEVGQITLDKRLEEEFDNSYELEQTVKNFYAFKEESDSNYIYELLNYDYKHYSILALQGISVSRLDKSDIIDITYETDDPGICQYTLILLSQIFIKNYKLIKENQSDAVIKYFQEQVNNANTRLQRAEDELLRFNKENSIINYNEQTKFIAEKKENLDEEYQQEIMREASSKAAMERLENQLTTQSNIVLNREELLALRNKLATVTSKLAYKQFELESNPNFQGEIQTLKIEADNIKRELANAINEEYALTNTKEGIKSNLILDQWLESMIEYEESNARIKVFIARQAEFQSIYENFAPLGAKLKRIEREINVAEQEYLQLLTSLNLSKLKQQNIELSSNIKPVGFPFYPISPKSQKKKLMVPAALLLGILLTAFIIIILEFYDKNINPPDRAKNFTGMDVAIVYPIFPLKHGKVNYPFIKNRLTELLIQDIKSQTTSNNSKPIVVGIFSTHDGEGKSMITTEVVNKIRESGDKVLYLNYDTTSTFEDNLTYSTNIKFPDTSNINQFNDQIGLLNKYNYIFIEFPSLILHSNPPAIIEKLNISYVVCQSKRIWKDADKKATSVLDSQTNTKSRLVLNASKLDVIENFISEIPKRRNAFRRFFKNLLTPKAR